LARRRSPGIPSRAQARKQLRATPTAYATEGVFDRVEVREAMRVFPAEE